MDTNTNEGPDLDHDTLLGEIQKRSSEEYERASDAADSGAKLKEFLEDTGMNSQAFSWSKAIIKKLPKKDGQAKAMDVIRSLEVALPMIKAHVVGQGTGEMDLDAAGDKLDDTEPVEPMADDDTPDDLPDDIAKDNADFEDAAGALDDEDGNVVKAFAG